MLRKLLWGVPAVLVCSTVLAQESASFKLTEYTFNAGGTPADGAQPTSSSFRITFDSIGDAVSTTAVTSSTS